MFKNYLLLPSASSARTAAIPLSTSSAWPPAWRSPLSSASGPPANFPVDQVISRTAAASWRSCKTNGQKGTSPEVAQHLCRHYGLVRPKSLAAERTTRMYSPEQRCLIWPGDGISGQRRQKYLPAQGSWAEYSFPLIFGYHFLSGNAESLRDP